MKKVLLEILILMMGIVIMAKKPGNPPGQEVNPGVEESADPLPTDSSLGGKRAYVIIPSSYKDLYVIGMDSDGRKYGYGLSEDEKDEIAALNDININAKEYYDDLKILEISTEATEDIKLVVGYKLLNKDKYVLLSSEDIDEIKLTENYKDGDTLRIIDLKDYTEYSKFPGYEASEYEVMTGIRVGVVEMDTDGRIDSSNIIKKFDSSEVGLNLGVEILPSASYSQFVIKSKDKKAYIINGSGDSSDTEYTYITLTQDKKDIETTEVKIRPQKKDGKLILNNKLYILNPHNVIYLFKGDFQADIINVSKGNGQAKGQWELKLTGTATSIDYIKNGKITSVDLNSGQIIDGNEVYVIESEGLHYEGSVRMTSGEEKFRRRESNIEINVLGSEGIEIKSINE